MLWASGALAGYASPYWITFKQALELGGHVRKGEKGSPVVYASTFKRTETDDKRMWQRKVDDCQPTEL